MSQRRRARQRGGNSTPAERPRVGVGRNPRRWASYLLPSALLVTLVAGWWFWERGPEGFRVSLADRRDLGESRPQFVGAAVCSSCHQEEFEAWEGSQHAQSMQEVSEASVLGDFDDATFTHSGKTTTFFRRDGQFMVRTDGRDGVPADFAIRYTFGVEPLQQYLIEFPDGRLQPLSIAWDSRAEDEGGGRWFHVYGDQEIDYTDDLHWTGVQQNWNYMCADCHSTNVQRGYDAVSDQFATTWSEINVACEACHGPGSRHIEWAESDRSAGDGEWSNAGLTTNFLRKNEATWTIHSGAETAERSGPSPDWSETTVCAQCHSQRAQIAEGYVAGAPFEDYYLLAPLTPGVYHPDGQQLDEVYTYGSFLQSRMSAAGVTCSNCHDPHAQTLRAPGNQLCAQCHSTSRYDAPTHHFHSEGGEGAQCVSCHMAATTYMVVDPRRDHSIRIPRPDLSITMGVPNACTQCHTDQTDAWAAQEVERWYGRAPTGFQQFAQGFYLHEQGDPSADSLLAAIASDPAQPHWVQASALERMAARPGPDGLRASQSGVLSPSPGVRRSALAIAETLPEESLASLAVPLLEDPSRIVRLQAAWVLAPLHTSLEPAELASFSRASQEFVASHELMADRPENRSTLGSFLGMMGRHYAAETQFLAAIRLNPRFGPAYVNLADVYRVLNREADARRILVQGLGVLPDDPSLHHSMGLALARAGELAEAVHALARASALAPGNARYTYAYAIALHSTGDVPEAIRTLVAALARHPQDRDILLALSTFHRDEDQKPEALRYAELLSQAHPGDPQARALLAELRGAVTR